MNYYNIKQYVTNLVSVGTDNTLSTIANMIPASSWYHHNMVLMVLCLSVIVIVLILAIFTKLSMLNTTFIC